MTHVVGGVPVRQDPSAMNTYSGLLLGSNSGSDIFQQHFVLPHAGRIGTVVAVRRSSSWKSAR